MYWVVLSCALLVESWLYWFLFWYAPNPGARPKEGRRNTIDVQVPNNSTIRVPFYSYMRLMFLLYLVLPQTQGARFLYEEYLHPRIEEHEAAIEELIASSHDRLRAAGIDYLNRAIELLKTNVFGLPPTVEPAGARAAGDQPQNAHSYTQSLLARFNLPSTKWNQTQAASAAAAQGAGGGLTADFFNLLSSAVSTAAASATAPAPPSASAPSKAQAGAGGSGSGSFIPESVRAAGAAASVSFIEAQRERLRIVLSELEREEAAARQQAQQGGGLESLSAAGGDKRKSVGEISVASGLSKSRSEPDFEKLDVPSGEEEDDGNGGVRRRAAAGQGTNGGGWVW